MVQTGLITWLELSGQVHMVRSHLLADKLTVVMGLIIGIVGCLICVYAIGYMKDYNRHHLDYEDRRHFFFAAAKKAQAEACALCRPTNPLGQHNRSKASVPHFINLAIQHETHSFPLILPYHSILSIPCQAVL